MVDYFTNTALEGRFVFKRFNRLRNRPRLALAVVIRDLIVKYVALDRKERYICSL